MSEPARTPAEPASNENLPAPRTAGGAVSLLDMEITEQDLDRAKRQLTLIQRFVKDVLIEGIHYGPPFPGSTGTMLLKPGAQMLCELYRLNPRPKTTNKIEAWDAKPPFFHYEVTLDLVHEPTGRIVATATGSANSRETKHRFRAGERVCPDCGQPAIRKSKAEWGGGWYCNKKAGGCAGKFEAGDPNIEEQQVGRIENEYTEDLVHTLQAIAYKRALKLAVEGVTRSAGLLVDDDEDDPPAGSNAGGGGQRHAQNGGDKKDEKKPPVDDIGSEKRQALHAAFKKAGHGAGDVSKWLKETHGIDLGRPGFPAAKYDEILARLSDPTPLFQSKAAEEKKAADGKLL